jgi:hypothetical protein
MKIVIKGLAIALAVAGIIRYTPDFIRYMKIRAM